MAVTVRIGPRAVTVPQPDDVERGAPDDTWPVCIVGRGGRSLPVHLVLAERDEDLARWISRRVAAVRCVDEHWWQIRRLGRNGLVVRCENGARLEPDEAWAHVPAAYGGAVVSVTTPTAVYRFDVVHGAGGAPLGGPLGGQDRPTRTYSPRGYWRVAVVLCAALAFDEDAPAVANDVVRRVLRRQVPEDRNVTERGIEERMAYLYAITSVPRGQAEQLARRLVRARVVTRDDVTALLGPDPLALLDPP